MVYDRIRIFAYGQRLGIGRQAPRYAGETIHYISAYFDLDGSWNGYDSIRAVWWNGAEERAIVLDSSMSCDVPFEVVAKKGDVMVNLIASIVEDGVLTDRFTSYPLKVAVIDADVKLTGSETVPVTPSQFEQFVEAVKSDADRAEAGATASEASASEASASAEQATASAQSASESANQASESATASAQSAGASAESAQSASESATSAENARDKILSMRATAETLADGSQATASYSDGLLTLGIPKGDTGARGEKGETGETGATPNLSIGTVETLDPTESATATITGTAENPVLNLGLPQGKTGEVSYEDLSSLLPKDTTSGDIISIPDGQSIIPVESLKVALEPIQDLHGHDKPWSGGAGKNKYPIEIGDDFWEDNASGTTHSNNDGELIINVTAFEYSGVYGGGQQRALVNQQSVAKTVSFDIKGSVGATIAVQGVAVDITTSYQRKYVTIPANRTAAITIYGNGTANTIYVKNLAITEDGSTDFTPYSNICPISGHTECVTEVCGKNLFDKTTAVDGYIDDNNGQLSGSAPYKSTDYIRVVGGNSYYVVSEQTASMLGAWYDENKRYISRVISYANQVITAPSNASYVRLTIKSSATGDVNTFAVNYPSTDHDYHAYQGTTYTTDLGRTVYGGTLDVVSGELVADRAMVDLGSLNWEKFDTAQGKLFRSRNIEDSGMVVYNSTNFICSNYATAQSAARANGTISCEIPKTVDVIDNNYSDATAFKTAMDGVQLVYELATPQTYQLTPQTIALLKGTNNIWSDGKVTLTYNADIQRYISKVVNA